MKSYALKAAAVSFLLLAGQGAHAYYTATPCKGVFYEKGLDYSRIKKHQLPGDASEWSVSKNGGPFVRCKEVSKKIWRCGDNEFSVGVHPLWEIYSKQGKSYPISWRSPKGSISCKKTSENTYAEVLDVSWESSQQSGALEGFTFKKRRYNPAFRTYKVFKPSF